MEFPHYDSLEQRMVRVYRDLLAPFVPHPAFAEAPQQAYHRFVAALLDRLLAEPALLFPSLHEDDAYPQRFNCASYGKPKLKPLMKSLGKRLGDVFATLHSLALNPAAEALSLPRRKQLTALGLSWAFDDKARAEDPQLEAGWRFLANQWPQGHPGFVRCWFDPAYPYLEKTMARFYDPEGFALLTDWLNAQGYRQYAAVQQPDSLDYVKSVKQKETPLGSPLFGDKDHYGLTFEYRYDAQIPAHYEPRVLRYADTLAAFDRLSPGAQRFILARNKRCDGCRYCVQTDKTGTRPLAALQVAGEALCPYFPSFAFASTRLTRQDAEALIAFLADQETLLLTSAKK